MDVRWLKIIQYLEKTGASATSKELAGELGVSTKTIKTILSQHDASCDTYGCRVHHDGSSGYRLEIIDMQKFSHLLIVGKQAKTENELRLNAIIERLILENDYIRIEALADEMYVSRATIDRLIPQIRALIAPYQLTLTSRSKYGIRLEGDEVQKRLCYSHQIMHDVQQQDQYLTSVIQTDLLSILPKHHIVLNDLNFYNLVLHCVIAVKRIMTGNTIHDDPIRSFALEDALEQKAAKEIAVCFEARFHIVIPAQETQYIVMHLLGKRVLAREAVLQDEVLLCVDEILQRIKAETHIDLIRDNELKTAMALHIQPLLSRLRFGFTQANETLNEIKREMSTGYELALIAFQVIQQQFHLAMSEDEIGYIAVHLAVALDRLDTPGTDKKIVIVCSTGRGTAKLIQHRLVNRYHFQADHLIITSAFQLDQIDFDQILYILTTIPLLQAYPVPCILIDPILSQKSLEKIDKLLNKMPPLEDTLWNDILLFPHQACTDQDEVIYFWLNLKIGVITKND